MQVIGEQVLRGVTLCFALAIWVGTIGGVQARPHAGPDDPLIERAPRPFASALHALRGGDAARADALAARDGAVARDLIEWMRLRAGDGTPDEVLSFLKRKPHWPGLDFLRRRSETAFIEASDSQVLAFFDDFEPRSGDGALRYARALTKAGRKGEAEAVVVLAWRTLDLDEEAHQTFLAEYGDLLGPHHAARLDEVIWRGWSGDTDRMIDRVSGDQAALARARLALQSGAANVDAVLAEVPEALRQDAGLAFDLFEWRVRRKRHEDAKKLMAEQSLIPGGLAYPDRWANRRRSYAREEMREGDPKLAYALASTHQLVEGSNFADLEWLAGYIALRHLDRADLALGHFERLQAAVATPISLGRAGYWRGRAHEALGQKDRADAVYRAAAEHQTSFYGLLAAERAGVPIDPALAGKEKGGDWRDGPVAKSDLREAAMLWRAAGVMYEAERFLIQLAGQLEPVDIASLGEMLVEAGDSHLQVMVGKAAASRGIVLPRYYYPLHELAEMKLPIAPEMALAIARRESEFDPTVTSSVGARGIMQLMPRTALDMAKTVRDTDDVSGRLGEWRYNARLGSAYLSYLAGEYGGNVMLMSVGYNAGPRRATRWSELFGDPRAGKLDPVDWVETIPFRETRNYVQRVAESLPVYRARLGKPPLPIAFSAELLGSTLPSLAPQGE
jgi:soluble lytic murein transglycosylase